MHVAFFNRSFYPDTSATGQLLTQLCESLVDTHGGRVSVVAGVPQTPVPGTQRCGLSMLGRETYRGIDILRARGTRFSKRRFAGRFSNYGSYFLSACHAGLRLDRPDVVVAQTDPPIIGLAASLAARRFGAPFVMVYQDIFPEVGRLLEDFQSERVNRWLDRVNRALLRRSAAVVRSSVSNALTSASSRSSPGIGSPACSRVTRAPRRSTSIASSVSAESSRLGARLCVVTDSNTPSSS